MKEENKEIKSAASEMENAKRGETTAEAAGSSMTWRFQLNGLHCAACAAAVTRAVKPLPGVRSVDVNPLSQLMKVIVDSPADVNPERVLKAVAAAGYGGEYLNADRGAGHVASGQTDTPNSQRETTNAPAASSGRLGAEDRPVTAMDKAIEEDYREARRRFYWSLIFMLPLMYISMGPMLGLPLPAAFSATRNLPTYGLIQFLLVLPVLAANWRLFQRGFISLFKLNPNMDSLIAVGSGAATLYGVIILFRMNAAQAANDAALLLHLGHSLYFESAVVILTLIALGKMLESRAKKRTGDSLRLLLGLAPSTAWRERGDGEAEEVAVDRLKVGDIIVIKPGQKIPVDGSVIDGHTSVDASALTGESLPLEKTTGDAVLSGMVNLNGSIRFKAEAVGEQTTLAQIIRLVEEASSSKAPVSRLADKVAAIFVPAVIGIALLTFIVWMALGADVGVALNYAITVLVISCPCALGLATPVAIMVGTGQGARMGILLRSAEALELAGHVDTVVMDKTGTLTQGKPRVTDIVAEYGKADAALRYAAALEAMSEHPLAAAVLEAARLRPLSWPELSGFSAVPGLGVSGYLEGEKLLAGSRAFLEREVGKITPKWARPADELAAEGKTCLYVARDREIMALIAVADKEKAGAADAVARFHARGLRTIMLSGDRAAAAQPLAARLGIDEVLADVLPQDKAREVTRLQNEGRRVMMLGDGINDAPALAAAAVGVAMGEGTDIAMESADMVLLGGDIRTADSAIALSKQTLRIIHENLFWAFFYNVLLIPLGAGVFAGLGVYMSPMLGAAAMSLSSLFVVTNALRLRRFKPKTERESGRAGDKTVEKAWDGGEQADLGGGFARDGGCINGDFVIRDIPLPNEKILPKLKGEQRTMEKVIKIEGMSCEHCVRHVKQALEKLPGVKADVNLEAKEARISSAQMPEDAELRQAVIDAGYEVRAIEG